MGEGSGTRGRHRCEDADERRRARLLTVASVHERLGSYSVVDNSQDFPKREGTILLPFFTLSMELR